MRNTVGLLALGAALLALPALAAAQESATIGIKESGCAGGRGLCFDQDTLALEGGVPVTVTLHNNGQIPHSFCVRLASGEKCTPNAGSGGTNAGGTANVELTGPAEGGAAMYYCKEPGHQVAGMSGNLTFSPRESMGGNNTGNPPTGNNPPPKSSPEAGFVAIVAGVALLAIALRRK